MICPSRVRQMARRVVSVFFRHLHAVFLLLALFAGHGARAEAVFANVAVTPLNGMVDTASGKLNVTVSGTVKATNYADAITSVTLYYDNQAAQSKNYKVRYTPAENPINDERTISFTVPVDPGAHTIQLGAFPERAGVGYTPVYTVAATGLTNSAQVSAQAPLPATVTAGQSYTVSVTMLNTGTTTWTTSGDKPYSLGSVGDNVSWNSGRVGIAGSVAPGAAYKFDFTVTAPTQPGTYNYRWQMVQDKVEWFGAATDAPLTVTVVAATPPPTVSLTGPTDGGTYLATGATAAVPVSGTATAAGTATISKIELLDNGVVVPAATTSGGTFNASVALAPGPHSLQLRATDSVNKTATSAARGVTVLAVTSGNGARFVSQNVPATMRAGQPYTLTVTMQNTGTTTWTPGANYRLGAQNPQDNHRWVVNGRAYLSAPAATGEMAVFTIPVTAPSPAATYNFQWRMLQENVAWFGDLSTNLAIAVGNGPGPAATLSATSANVRVSGTQTATVTFNAKGVASSGTIAKLELFQGTDSTGFSTTASQTFTGSAATLGWSPTVNLPAGVYFFKLRATDAAGVATESAVVMVNITNSALLGQVSGVATRADKNYLLGWTCQSGTAAPLNYQLFLDAPTFAAGATLLESGVANIATEANNAAVQTQCGTPGAGHNFTIDLSPYTQYAGRQLFVRAANAAGTIAVTLPCADNSCTVPGSLRVGISTPASGAIVYLPNPAFLRMVVAGASKPLDEVGFVVNGSWVAAKAEADAPGAYSVSASLAASATPYTVQAKIRQGNITLVSAPNQFTVSSATAGTVAITAPSGATAVMAGAVVPLTASVNGTPASVKFFANTAQIGTATASSGNWNYNWTTTVAGTYSVVARSYDAAGTQLGASAAVAVTVTAVPASSPTPIAVTIAPPHLGNDNAGSLPGDLTVTPSGAAAYGIPIVVPPGTAGMQPELSLSYSSEGTNGLLGLGWQLGGLSSIHRCGKTIAQDGVNDRISFSASDRLCLDGQRLVLVNLPLTDANYWADGAQYRTEIDSFSRVTALGATTPDNIGNRSFKVEARDGRIMTFGGGATSAVRAIVGAINGGTTAGQPTAKNGAQSWALDRITDRSGNYISFSYQQDASSGEHRPDVIRYGAAGLPAHAAVQFSYEARTDAWKRYIDESRNDLRSRVSHVKTYVGADLDATALSDANIVRDYRLSYEQSPTSGRSLLNSVQVCARAAGAAAANDCLPATVFSWGKPDPAKKAGFESKGIWAGGPSLTTFYNSGGLSATANHPDYFAFSDFENNGYTDILEKRVRGIGEPLVEANGLPYGTMQAQYRYFHNTGTGFVQYRYQLDTGEPFIVLDTGDFNGDGALDLLVTTSGSASGFAKICLSPLGRAGALGSPDAPIQFTCDASRPAVGANSARAFPYVVDVVGDGRSAHYSTNVNGIVTVCIQGTCQRDTSPPAALTMVGGDDGSDIYALNQYTRLTQMVDFTGVGKMYDVRWSRVNLVKYIQDGSEMIYSPHYENLRPTVAINNFNQPGIPYGRGAMVNYTYPAYPQPPKNTFYLPYQFDRDTDMGSISTDFNGSGYNSLAFGYLELAWDPTNSYYSYSRAEMTLCLSTGRALDCAVRKKYSGANYLAVRSVNNFVGDGQATILADVLSYPAGDKPRPSGNLQMCRVTGDDTTGGAGVDDGNMVCQPWSGATMPILGADLATDNVFFMDLMGTGRTQIVKYHGGKFDAAKNWQPDDRWEVFAPVDQAVAGQALDRIHQVANGFGAIATVEYVDAVPSGTVTRTAEVAPSYPQRPSPRVGKIVRTLTARKDGGAALSKKISYRYQNAAVDAYGRGSLGFARVIATDELNHTATSTAYSQTWPLTGMALGATTTHGAVVLSDSIQTLQSQTVANASGQSTYFPYVAKVVTGRKDLDGSALGTTTTTNTYGDAWGNLTEQSVEFDNHAYKSTVATTYLNDAANWIVGKPKLVTTTKTDADNNTLTRQSSYDYDAATGLVKTEVQMPNVAALQVTTSYDRTGNKFGLVNKTTQSWNSPIATPAHAAAGARSRVVSDVAYDDRGRFPISVKNALTQAQSESHDAATGARTGVTDANLLSTTWSVDGFGRIVKQVNADGNEARSYLKRCDSACPPGAVLAAIVDSFHTTGANAAGVRIATPRVAYHDGAGNVLRSLSWGFDGAQIVQDQRYDDQGRLTEVERPHVAGAAAFLDRKQEYDDLGRVIKLSSFDEMNREVVTTTQYNGLDVTATNAKRQSRIEHHAVNGQLASVTDAKGGVTAFGYDAFGNLARTTDPDGNVITVVYDAMGRKTDLKDPDLGWVHYDVDPLGRTWKQTSPKQRAAGTATVMDFDMLDRMTQRYETDLESHWDYDGTSNGKGIGKLATAYTMAGGVKDYQRLHTYDALGRSSQVVLVLTDGRYTATQIYDEWSRPLTQKYQRNSGAEKAYSYRYNANGRQYQVLRGDLVLAETLAQDAHGRTVDIKFGNGLRQKRRYNDYTGRLEDARLSAGASVEHLSEGYQYDSLGNVLQRSQYWDGVGFQEVFEYDDLNRISVSTLGGQAAQRFTYSAAGSLLTKANVGAGATYQYPAQGAAAVRPHAVKSIASVGDFIYDLNGNLESGAGRTTTWSSFDMPLKVANGASVSGFVYGPEHQRTYQCKGAGANCGNGTGIVYAGRQEVEVKNGQTTVKTYWPDGLGVEIDKTDQSGQPVTELNWMHVDRLGSPVLITDVNGNVREKLAYDTWGKRRNYDGSASGGSVTPNTLDGLTDNKGYTGHEMLDDLDLVHMNGRLYDPLIGKFLSGDPLVQDPVNGQNYNRYSYVLNNPTNLTDPTGFRAEYIDVTGSAIPAKTPEEAQARAQGLGTQITVYREESRPASSQATINTAGTAQVDGKNASANTIAEKAPSDPTSQGASGQQEFTSDQVVIIHGGIKRQQELAGNMLNSLSRWNENDQAQFERAFGTRSVQARRTMQALAQKEKNSGLTVKNFRIATPSDFGGRDPSGVFAFVHPEDASHTIYVGGLFWGGSLDEIGGTIFHEFSHFNNIGPTQDRFGQWYGGMLINSPFLMRELKDKRPDLSIWHSYTIENYAKGVK